MTRRLRQWGRVSARVVSAAALALLMALEGFSALPYPDIGGVWTNGFGNTEGVTQHTPPVTREQAKQDLEQGVAKRAAVVDRCLRVPVTQNQYDALALWAYNVGTTAACGSTLMRRLNAGAPPHVWCAELLKWNKVRQAGRLVPSKGLTNRRKAEFALCMKA
jgi:lysozyme